MIKKTLYIFSIVVIAAGLSWAEESNQEIQMMFNPPDQTTFTVESKVTKIKDMGAYGRQSDISASKSRIEVQKTPAGYKWVTTPVSLEMKRNGRTIDGPMTNLMNDIAFTYHINGEGKITKVMGYGEMIEKMNARMTPQQVEAMAAMMSEEALINKDIAEWNGRIGNMAGKSVKIGEQWDSVDKYPLPTGEVVTYFSVTTFKGMEPCGTGQCLRIEFEYDSDVEAMAGFLKNSLNNMASQIEGVEEFNPSNIEMSGGGERLIDPQTMLIYYEKVKRKIKMNMESQGALIPLKLTEVRIYNFEYGSPKTKKAIK